MKAIKLGPETLAYALCVVSEAPDGYIMRVSEPTRTLDQNAAMWPLLEAWSDQLEWPVNGVQRVLTPEEWKEILSAAYREEVMYITQGLNGGVVLLGQRTSKFTVKQFSEFLDFIQAEGALRGIDFARQPNPAIEGEAYEVRSLPERTE